MLINNLTDILKTEVLTDKYYMCDLSKARELVLNGFSPISITDKQYYIFYKSAVLMEFLRKGEIK